MLSSGVGSGQGERRNGDPPRCFNHDIKTEVL